MFLIYQIVKNYVFWLHFMFAVSFWFLLNMFAKVNVNSLEMVVIFNQVRL